MRVVWTCLMCAHHNYYYCFVVSASSSGPRFSRFHPPQKNTIITVLPSLPRRRKNISAWLSIPGINCCSCRRGPCASTQRTAPCLWVIQDNCGFELRRNTSSPKNYWPKVHNPVIIHGLGRTRAATHSLQSTLLARSTVQLGAKDSTRASRPQSEPSIVQCLDQSFPT